MCYGDTAWQLVRYTQSELCYVFVDCCFCCCCVSGAAALKKGRKTDDDFFQFSHQQGTGQDRRKMPKPVSTCQLEISIWFTATPLCRLCRELLPLLTSCFTIHSICGTTHCQVAEVLGVVARLLQLLHCLLFPIHCLRLLVGLHCLKSLQHLRLLWV